MSELADMITAAATAAGVVGGGIAWLSQRIDRRFRKVETELAACRQREIKAARRETALIVQVRETAAKYLTVIELLWREVDRRSRGQNDVLERAGQLLDKLKEDAKHD